MSEPTLGSLTPSAPPLAGSAVGLRGCPCRPCSPSPGATRILLLQVLGSHQPRRIPTSTLHPALALLWGGGGGVQPILNSKPAINPFSQPSPCPPCSHGAGRSIPAAAPRSPPAAAPPLRCPVCTQGCARRLFTRCTCHIPFYTDMYRGKAAFDGEKANATAKNSGKGN